MAALLPTPASIILIVLSTLLFIALAATLSIILYRRHTINAYRAQTAELRQRYQRTSTHTRLVTSALKDSLKRGCAANQNDLKLLALAGKRDRDVWAVLSEEAEGDANEADSVRHGIVEKAMSTLRQKGMKTRKAKRRELVFKLRKREELDHHMERLHADLLTRTFSRSHSPPPHMPKQSISNISSNLTKISRVHSPPPHLPKNSVSTIASHFSKNSSQPTTYTATITANPRQQPHKAKTSISTIASHFSKNTHPSLLNQTRTTTTPTSHKPTSSNSTSHTAHSATTQNTYLSHSTNSNFKNHHSPASSTSTTTTYKPSFNYTYYDSALIKQTHFDFEENHVSGPNSTSPDAEKGFGGFDFGFSGGRSPGRRLKDVVVVDEDDVPDDKKSWFEWVSAHLK